MSWRANMAGRRGVWRPTSWATAGTRRSASATGIWPCGTPSRGYFCRTVRNLAAKRYRADTAQKRNARYDAALDELAELVAAPGGVEDELNAKELTAAIDRFLDGLDYRDRYLFMRRYWYGDDLAVISDETGLAPRRISVRLFRLREKLKNQLVKEGMIP